MLRPDWSRVSIEWNASGIGLGIGVNACISSALATIMPVVLTKHLSASYLETSLFMIVGTLSSTIAVYVLGRISDRPGRRYPAAVGSALCGMAGAAALSAVSGYWAYLFVFSSLIAIGASLFPQLMALAFLRAKKSTSIMRAIVSGGWVVGPPLAGVVLSVGSPSVVFLSVAGAYGGLLLLIAAQAPLFRCLGGTTASGQAPTAAAPSQAWGLFATVSMLASIHLVLALCALAVPWRILELGGSSVDVGMAFSIAAAVEIPIIVFSGRIVERLGQGTVLLGCAILISLYFLIGAKADQVGGIFVVSLLNGGVTGMMMGASLLVLQGMLPDRPGHASSIYSNMLRLTYVAALLAAGLIAQRFSVAAVFWTASIGAFCLAGAQVAARTLLPSYPIEDRQVR